MPCSSICTPQTSAQAPARRSASYSSALTASATVEAPRAQAPTGPDGLARLEVNSSHHQAVGVVGDGLLVSARCPQDAVVEAIEGGQAISHEQAGPHGPAHFVLGVQWHPERTLEDPTSRALFDRFVREAKDWTPRAVTTSVAETVQG